MGKKAKVGKNRKDIFYKRAKEAGYRARSAYKLIQLNKKFNFLQTSRVCIDLCAAPGSWMQVAAKFMPVSSVIIGVDRYAIASIPNTISIQGDITTEKVRQDLKGNLKNWKADLVLHDGAPHVGQNWLYDAYQQNLLVLHAFKLACEFLQKGGTFLTKVFRSKDHFSLEYVFRKLFKRVETTKPIASRFASAEIFIVCLGYLAPDKVDPEFFDPKFVFQTLEAEPANNINILKPEKMKRKATGYEEGITMLFKKNSILEFLSSPRFIEILEESNELEWDCPAAKKSIHTTSEIIESCKDIKVLGRRELKGLLNWRKLVKAEFEEAEKTNKPVAEKEKEEKEEESDEVDEELKILQKIQEEVSLLKADQAREEKQRKRKVEKKKKKIEEKLNLRLMVPGDPGPQEAGNDGLFSINTLDFTNALDDVVDQNTEILAESDDDFSDSDQKRTKREFYSKSGTYLDNTGSYHKKAGDADTDNESDEDDSDAEGLNLDKIELKEQTKKKSVRFADEDEYQEEEDDDTRKRNPLTTDLVGDKVADKRERKAENWFSDAMFDELDTEDVEDYEIESAIEKHKKSGVNILSREDGDDEAGEEELKEEGNESGYASGSSDMAKKKKKDKRKKKPSSYLANDAPDSESDFDSDDEVENVDYEGDKDSDDSDDAEDDEKTHTAVVDEDETETEAPKKRKKSDIKLTPFGLALATKMIRSKKAKRDLYNDGWNRYMCGEEDLPEWFAADERVHNNPKLAVKNSDLKMYQDRSKPVDARTIKKVVEAKARKQRRMKKKVAKARKKAEAVVNSEDMSAREKALEMKKIYKKVTSTKPKEKTYVVMKKQYLGKRPKGVKGPIKLVDKRMKKDKRAKEAQNRRTKRRR